MSLLLSPLLLFVAGMVIARVSKARRVWRRHGLFTRKTSALVLAVYLVTELSLLLDLAWVQPLVRWLPGATGTDWVVGSGFLDQGGSWPIASKGVMAFVILSFALLPFWLWMGVTTGYWLWGRSPKQTGIMGLLR